MKVVLDQAIADIEALQDNLYRVRLVLSEIPDPRAWSDGVSTAIDGIKTSLANIGQQVAQAQAQLTDILQAREASEKGIAILVEEMAALVAAVNQVKNNLETTTNQEAA